MRSIHIAASNGYEVLIGSGLLARAAEHISALGGAENVMLVSDDNVFPLYGEALAASLAKAGLRVGRFVFPHGERSKNLRLYGELLEAMSVLPLTRADLVIALGGGVTGDLAGFAAATYQRGIRYVQIPTTLLAAVDASVGGKTAVDLPQGKNLAGCFHQPSLVICDTDTFATLPEAEYRSGCAEVIKYAVIGDADFFAALEETPIAGQEEQVIAKCVGMKRDIVERDEYDTEARMLLNFGHTFGHAAEACSEYLLPHGYAVAMGMAAVTRAACKHGVCDTAALPRLLKILQAYGLPTEIDFPLEEMYAHALQDKKSAGGRLRLIVPERIGKCRIEEISREELYEWLRDGGVK